MSESNDGLSAFRLVTYHQCCALDLGETGKVLHLVSGGQLTTCCDAKGKETFVENGLEICAGSIDGSGVAGRARTDDNNFGVHLADWGRSKSVGFRDEGYIC